MPLARLGSLSSLSSLTWLGVALRAGLLAYAAVQDTHPVIKFTDIDYSVFTDAAAFVAAGRSPYLRSTYRYTPLLAVLMTPNVLLHPICGKLLFCLCDLVAGAFLFAILRSRSPAPGAGGPGRGDPMPLRRAWLFTALWTLNPFVAVISARGSAESVVAILVIGTLWGAMTGRPRAAAVFFGLAVHFKIFPIVYAVPLWFGIDYACDTFEHHRRLNGGQTGRKEEQAAPEFKLRLWSWRRFEFGLISGGTFLALSLIMYSLYGHDFLEHTYLYHVTRKDHRHNFSLYFYEIYLGLDLARNATAGVAQGLSVASVVHAFGALWSFIPQLGLVAALGVACASDLPFACFVQTFAFVMLNKVCTSQYFMWYICLLPLVLPHSRLTNSNWRTGVGLLVGWIFGQALWLSQAFRLEHLGHNTFRNLWAASAVFLGINVWILTQCIRNHIPQ
ncbi:GPI mannosyltransferase 1 [Polyrhizophydium stewartii]|uniref:GPI mannosyltransferase 1 n=1 Tax=Polyrhizophydium stewartii TaxID=2732419 RepID=A0ABR4NIW8_9FUNG|nr:hypothetical protein HK105_004146 [Polyrhizophydium stewartii]